MIKLFYPTLLEKIITRVQRAEVVAKVFIPRRVTSGTVSHSFIGVL